ncbi:hypothetical protein ACQKNX_23115 [Lysinibacillus sp. NPDC093712]|uniref:hypothetical protein n=1 Tax=Lysinibacillus sp. NPDC093712 TaxID=3390579 RepID=UPI003CFE39F5
MIYLKKKTAYRQNLLDYHENKIIEELNFKHKPVVYYGHKACDFLRDNVPAYKNKTNKRIRRSIGGCFLSDLSEEYKETGVVCVFNGSIGTLAHELRHAKQYQDDSKWLKRGKWYNFLYKYGYGFYPSEREAFQFAAKYLKKAKLNKLACFYNFRRLGAAISKTRFLWPIYFIGLLLYILWLQKLFAS